MFVQNITIKARALELMNETPLEQLVRILGGSGWSLVEAPATRRVTLTDGVEEIEVRTGDWLVRIGDELDIYEREAYFALPIDVHVG